MERKSATQYAIQNDGDTLRTRNQHMLLRGKTWQLKMRIPVDVFEYYEGRSSKFIEESLKTGDVKDARLLRDQKLRNYQKLWNEMRIRTQRRLLDNDSQTIANAYDDRVLLDLRENEVDAGELISILGGEIDRLASPLAQSGSIEDLSEARDAVMSHGRGQEMWREIQILRGDMTPLAPLCSEWFETKRGRAAKTRTEYARAIKLLLEHFEFKEQVEQRKVKAFLNGLLQSNAKATVQKYTTAFKGVWEYQGWHDGVAMWSVRQMDSAVQEIKVGAISDGEYSRIMEAIKGTKKRRLWLAIRIAAYSGASRSGVCGLRLEGADTDKPSLYLPETKKAWRTRLVPCHPEILEDVKEWLEAPLAPTAVTNEFTAVKRSVGLGRDRVYHSFRHSVANKLENARINSREIKRLLGHRIGNITFDTYSAEGLDYDVLEDVISKIEWPDVK